MTYVASGYVVDFKDKAVEDTRVLFKAEVRQAKEITSLVKRTLKGPTYLGITGILMPSAVPFLLYGKEEVRISTS